jgi:hypothetical protein
MIDVAHSVNPDQQRLDFPHGPIFQQQYFANTPTPASFATTTIPTQPLLTAYDFDLTGELSNIVY